jgi:hypothetical protein
MEELSKLQYNPDLPDEDVFEDEPCPDDLVFDVQPFGMDFHPSQNLIATGLVSGGVSVVRYGDENNERVLDLHAHEEAVRCVRFDQSGRFLLSTGTDMKLNVVDLNTLQVVHTNPRIHLNPLSSMICYDTHFAATGDDKGCVKLWDLRQQQETCSFQENSDYISDLAFHPDRKRLLATGGDGHLSVFNPRGGKLDKRSEFVGDELLSVQWIKNGKFAVAGTQEGVLMFWKAGEWENICTQFPGHPESVDALLAIDEDTVITGSSDGLLRIVSVLPNKLLGVVGDHGGDFPIEAISMSFNKGLLASASHDNRIKFWNINYLFEEDDDDDDDGEEAPMDEADDGEVDNRGKRVAAPGEEKQVSKNKQKKAQFFNGL